MKRACYPKFKHFSPWFWTSDFGTNDISFGLHICWAGRLDLHILFGMLSIGRVPIYEDWKGKLFAASNSYHEDRLTNQAKHAMRAGVPNHS